MRSPNGIQTFTTNGVAHLDILQREYDAREKLFNAGVKEGRRLEREDRREN